MKNTIKIIAAIIICESVGLVAALFTFASIPNWYVHLIKPAFTPPAWVFGPAWTVLYFLMGIAAGIVWDKKKNRTAVRLFSFQLILNFLWSVLFFGMQWPLLGLIDIAALWLLIIMTIQKFYPLSKTAAYLLIPYFYWVSFASILNLAVVILN